MVAAVKQLLELRGYRVFRRNTGAVAGEYTTKAGAVHKRFIRFAEPGQSDLYGWRKKDGKHLEVEVKKPGSYTKPERWALQQAYLEQARGEGCIAFWCDSLATAIFKLDAAEAAGDAGH